MAIKYNEEFKKTVVSTYETTGKSPSLVAKEYGVSKSTISRWVKLYSKECLHPRVHTTNIRTQSKRVSDLQKRIHELEKENDFLKKASAFFVTTIE